MFFRKRRDLFLIFSILFNIFYSNYFAHPLLSEINTKSYFSELNVKDTNKNKENELLKNASAYRLGPGDELYIKFVGLKEFSKNYFIGPAGEIFLPEIKEVNVNNLTIKELENLLLEKYQEFLINPKIDIAINSYRPVRIYVIGEVARPGFYTVRGEIQNLVDSQLNQISLEGEASEFNFVMPRTFSPSGSFTNKLFPTVFDAIKAAQGITVYTNLSNVELIRNIGYKSSEKVKTNLNLLSLITEGDQSQNLRLLDGDTVVVYKSENVLKEQIANTIKTNISPDVLSVYVTGNVINTGRIQLPSGSGLNQALAQAGGKKILSGKIEFLRFNDADNIDKRTFSYDLKAKLNSYKNPVLMSGDIVNVRRSIIGNTSAGIAEISKPIVGIYSLYNLFYD